MLVVLASEISGTATIMPKNSHTPYPPSLAVIDGQSGGSFDTATTQAAVAVQQPTAAAIATACTTVYSAPGGNGGVGNSEIPLGPGLTADFFVGIKNSAA